MLQKKQSKKPKDKLSLMKRFIMGEDVIDSILHDGISRITGFRVVDPNDLSKLSTEQLKELNGINDEGQRSQRFKQMMRDNNKDGITWFESKSYEDKPSWLDDLTNYQPSKEVFPDPELPNVSYSNPDNVPEPLAASEVNDVLGRGANDCHSSEAANEPAIRSSKQQKMDNKLLEFQHIKELMKARKQRTDEFMRMNNQFSNDWLQ